MPPVGPGQARKDGGALGLLKEEFKLMTSLKHRNVITCLGFFNKLNEYWLVLEYANLGNMGSLISNYGPLEEQTVAVYAKQILHGMDYLHKNKVIHRDIKPSNLLLTTGSELMLADFGCSFKMEASQTNEGNIAGLKGSMSYMAPECLKETTLSRKADIWALGCTLLEMVTGKQPWAERKFDNVFSLMLEVATKNVTPAVPDTLSPELKDFLSKCLQREPKDRSSAEELLQHSFFGIHSNIIK